MSDIAQVNEQVSNQWDPLSWKNKDALHNPFATLPAGSLDGVEEELRTLPPLVHPSEIDDLKRQLIEVAEGKRFLLQGGDCAERFKDCNSKAIAAKLKILLQMSLVLSHATKKPVVRIGRMAGQYAKPRSSDYETVDGVKVETFKGDCVNGFNTDDRTPNPQRLVQSYFYASAVLNHVRSLLSTGFTDIHNSKHWQLEFKRQHHHDATHVQPAVIPSPGEGLPCSKSVREIEYSQMADSLIESLQSAAESKAKDTTPLSYFSSHEALVLPYESALTRAYYNGEEDEEEAMDVEREDKKTHYHSLPHHDTCSTPTIATKITPKYYNTSAHMIWIGERTRQPNNAHVEYCKGIQNPIGVKVGPTANPADIESLVRQMNPSNEKGKIILITRVGASKVENIRPLIRHIQGSGLNVIWQCDPMHGNTHTAKDVGLKTRAFNSILSEVLDTSTILAEEGAHLGGVHFELTGEDVTECTGGPQEIEDAELPRCYTTYCDPRLNQSQSLEIAFRLSEQLKKIDGKSSSSASTSADLN